MREKAKKLGIPEGPLWGKLQKGNTVEYKGKKFKPEQVMDYKKGRKGKSFYLKLSNFLTRLGENFVHQFTQLT